MSKGKTPGHFINFIQSRELTNTTAQRTSIVTDFHLEKAKKLYRKNLLQHYGCVNAIEFSSDGQLFVSGGDDRRVILWNVNATIHGQPKPHVMQAEHRSNIFVVAINNTNSKIFSGGNDDMVIIHDIETAKPLDYFTHEEPVYGISVDPLSDSIFATACDNGQLLLHDIRESLSSDPFCLAKENSAFHTVMFNPSEPRLLVSSNAKTGVALWDIRMSQQVLLRYGGKNFDQCSMSARFSQDGSKILALRRRLPPILYPTHDTNHLLQFYHCGYYNSCTMKSCSFAGTNDQFIVSGSDNFDLYMWKIPTEASLEGGDNRLVQQAHLILRGHRSIVNQVRFNTRYSILASSGVEKTIKFWSPFVLPYPNAKSCFETFPDYDRRIYSNNDYINLILQSGQYLSFDTSRRTTQEDPRMLAFFDALVQRDIEGMSDDDDFTLRYKRQSELSTNATLESDHQSLSSGEPAPDEVGDVVVTDDDTHESEHSNAFGDDLIPDSTDDASSTNGVDDVAAAGGNEEGVAAETDIEEVADANYLNKASQENQGVGNSRDEELWNTTVKEGELKNNVITQLIAQKSEKLIRMAQNHVILEAEGKPKVKRKHMNIMNRLRRLNRKTHSLTMNLLPCPEAPSSLDSDSNTSTSDSSTTTSSSSSSSSSSSTSSSSDDDDAQFIALKKKVTPLLIHPTASSQEVPITATATVKHHRATRERTARYFSRKNKKRVQEKMQEDDDKPCTSATALKREAIAISRKKEEGSTSSSSDTVADCVDFLTRLEEVSKRLKRVTNDLTSSSSILRHNRFNPKRKQQSTMIKCPSTSSSSSFSFTSDSDNLDGFIRKLPPPAAKRQKLSEASFKEQPTTPAVPALNENAEEPNSSTETILKRHRKASTQYRCQKHSESEDEHE